MRSQIEGAVFDGPAFDKSIIGITTDGNAVYDYELMVHELMESEGISETEAKDHIDHDVIGTLPYIDPDIRPVIMYRNVEMYIAGKELSATEALFYYKRNAERIAVRQARFGPADHVSQALARWNKQMEEEYGDTWKSNAENQSRTT